MLLFEGIQDRIGKGAIEISFFKEGLEYQPLVFPEWLSTSVPILTRPPNDICEPAISFVCSLSVFMMDIIPYPEWLAFYPS